MFSIPNFPQAPLSDIFADLAAGLKAGVTVITPNRRLAIALKREFNGRQARREITAWHSADILPFPAFVERLYEDALHSGQSSELPILLTPAQEQILWEDAIGHSDTGAALLAIGATARLARGTYQPPF